jgi:hypothetical protein
MIRYKCPACEKNQYSASEREADKPCIYCGNPGTKLMLQPDDQELEEEAKERYFASLIDPTAPAY